MNFSEALNTKDGVAKFRYFFKFWASIVGAIILVLLVIISMFTVAQYERAVVTTWGKYSYTAEPGLHFRVPIAQSVHPFRTDIQSITIEPDDKGKIHGVNTYTIDNQEVDVIFNVFYRLPPERVEYIYQNARDYRERLFNMTVDRIKSEMGKINVEHLAQKRGEVRDTIKKVLAAAAQVLGVEVTDFQLPNIEYTTSFRKAVEGAAAAKAMVETREQEKAQAVRVAERVKIEAEGKANGVREEARGEADARVLRATAEAKAIELQGEAQAKAIRLQAAALAENSRLVELRKAERWDGKLPVQMLSGVVPFMNYTAATEAK